jgi:predicted amidophosphoribosyltransferase
MKNTNVKLRAEALRAGYSIEPDYDFKGIYGFLIIDDIYESGATLREICRTLKRAQPEIPRFVATFTHLSSVWSQHR